MQTIHRIDIGSAFKVGLVLSALLFAVLGLFLLLLPSLLGAGLLRELAGGGGGGMFGAGLVGYIIGIVIYGIIGGIGAAINAFLYNIVAGLVGGLKVDIS